VEATTATQAVMEPAKNFFIIFVDAIFTTSFERLFTKSFDAANANAPDTCVYPLCITD
jgi:hypothetical protein